MTVYYSENTFQNEIIEVLEKDYPRAMYDSNHYKVPRSSTIDYNLLLEYFICALAKEHNSYLAAITLPQTLEGKIPSWYVRREKEIFMDASSGPKGKNVFNQDVFVVKFNFFVNERNIHKVPDTSKAPTEDTLIGQLIEMRHALIDENQESINILREFYQGGEIITHPKSRTSKYLANILDFPY